mmetsp:Transcript_44135/g.64585  ORF Transcript_44135/g.64585 Transcript_44135/m.64585 type:complete len:112 (-) Transcript_44135:14-349(-)
MLVLFLLEKLLFSECCLLVLVVAVNELILKAKREEFIFLYKYRNAFLLLLLPIPFSVWLQQVVVLMRGSFFLPHNILVHHDTYCFYFAILYIRCVYRQPDNGLHAPPCFYQ